MVYNRLIVLLITVLSLSVLTDCSDTARSRRTFHAELGSKGELVVAMDIDMPGYFALENGTFGYHYDLLSAYAEKLGVTLRIITGNTGAECRRMLAEGKVDIVATLDAAPGANEGAIPIYNTTYAVLASGAETKATRRNKHRSLAPMQGKRILISSGFKASPHYDTLMDSLPDTPKFISEGAPMDMIRSLAEGEYDYLICEKSEAIVGVNTYPELVMVHRFADGIPVHVALSGGVRGLREDFAAWLESYRAGEEYSTLDDLYMQRASLATFNTYRTAGDLHGPISQYDDVIRRVAEREGCDWRFLSAIAYHESRFKPNVVSNKGACGIMQIMPVVARHFNVPQELISDTETNVTLAAKLLKDIENSIKLPSGTAEMDRMCMVLACYNAGVGHIADARRLAGKHGYSPNSWSDVSRFLELKSQPDYYSDEVVRNGVFRGSRQTLAFVNNVMGQYDSYCMLAQR